MELRHLRYFTAVVQWKGYREASRHLYITQPSISEAVSDLESVVGIKLFSRDGRVARLTPEGQIFYEEAIKTLAQAERSIANRPARWQGRNRQAWDRLHWIWPPTRFSPDLLRKYKARPSVVALRLEENVPSGQDLAFDRGEIDIGFTRPPFRRDRRARPMNRACSSASRWSWRFPRPGKVEDEAQFASRTSQGSASSRFSGQAPRRSSTPSSASCNGSGFSPRHAQ